jgi:DNA repair exonuclease SbcCD ATPase subunit
MEMAAQAQEQVEDMKKRWEIMQEMENQLLAKSVLVDSLQAELNQASELLSSSNKTVSDAVKDLNQLNADLIVKERDNSDHTFYFGALETELNQLEAELKNENEEASHLSRNMEILMDELQEAKTKIYEIKEREKEAQIEIAVLKSELHKGRSELSAAEARTGSVKPGLYLAVQQLAVEAEAAERENQRLKGLDRVTEESEDFGLMHTDQHEKYSCQDVDAFQKNESNAESVKRRNENDGNITISLEEYEFLIRKAEKAGEFLRRESSNMSITSITSENKYESQLLKKELEIAIVKNRELRTRLEQAVTRAEAAEKAKTILEDQQKRRQEQKQRIKAAIVGLHEESTSREFSSSTYGSAPKEYQPLGKVLNMKF